MKLQHRTTFMKTAMAGCMALALGTTAAEAQYGYPSSPAPSPSPIASPVSSSSPSASPSSVSAAVRADNPSISLAAKGGVAAIHALSNQVVQDLKNRLYAGNDIRVDELRLVVNGVSGAGAADVSIRNYSSFGIDIVSPITISIDTAEKLLKKLQGEQMELERFRQGGVNPLKNHFFFLNPRIRSGKDGSNNVVRISFDRPQEVEENVAGAFYTTTLNLSAIGNATYTQNNSSSVRDADATLPSLYPIVDGSVSSGVLCAEENNVAFLLPYALDATSGYSMRAAAQVKQCSGLGTAIEYHCKGAPGSRRIEASAVADASCRSSGAYPNQLAELPKNEASTVTAGIDTLAILSHLLGVTTYTATSGSCQEVDEISNTPAYRQTTVPPAYSGEVIPAGAKPDWQGAVRIGTGAWTVDTCEGGVTYVGAPRQLTEYYCDASGNIQSRQITCSNGCEYAKKYMSGANAVNGVAQYVNMGRCAAPQTPTTTPATGACYYWAGPSLYDTSPYETGGINFNVQDETHTYITNCVREGFLGSSCASAQTFLIDACSTSTSAVVKDTRTPANNIYLWDFRCTNGIAGTGNDQGLEVSTCATLTGNSASTCQLATGACN